MSQRIRQSLFYWDKRKVGRLLWELLAALVSGQILFLGLLLLDRSMDSLNQWQLLVFFFLLQRVLFHTLVVRNKRDGR